MRSERALVDSIFAAALEGSGGDTDARKYALWIAGVTLLADALLQHDPFTRERLLKGLVPELRDGMAKLSRLLDPPADKTVH